MISCSSISKIFFQMNKKLQIHSIMIRWLRYILLMDSLPINLYTITFIKPVLIK